MTLNYGEIWKDVFVAHKRLWLTGIGLVVLILGVMFIVDRCGKARNEAYRAAKKAEIQKNLEAVAELQKAIDADKGDIKELKGAKSVLVEQIKQDTAELASGLEVQEDLRQQTNQALANFNAVSNSNANAVNRTAEDLIRQVERLDHP